VLNIQNGKITRFVKKRIVDTTKEGHPQPASLLTGLVLYSTCAHHPSFGSGT